MRVIVFGVLLFSLAYISVLFGPTIPYKGCRVRYKGTNKIYTVRCRHWEDPTMWVLEGVVPGEPYPITVLAYKNEIFVVEE